MGNTFVIEVYLPVDTMSPTSEYSWQMMWRGESWFRSILELHKIKQRWPQNAVKLTWR